jgi:hypothetical protein
VNAHRGPASCSINDSAVATTSRRLTKSDTAIHRDGLTVLARRELSRRDRCLLTPVELEDRAQRADPNVAILIASTEGMPPRSFKRHNASSSYERYSCASASAFRNADAKRASRVKATPSIGGADADEGRDATPQLAP